MAGLSAEVLGRLVGFAALGLLTLLVLANGIALPSGVHVIIDDGDPGGRVTGSVHSPDVSRFISPPAAATPRPPSTSS